ncbi:FG-GAP repeat protein [Aquisphaera giovannonii]|uniref:FG-GAP repeat protein n=1 Tax=Aquisphaera giovannonii TaxID=406548 RepID=A0A5B9VZW3_9BACT|nr:FG-GAP-like repeat-containing protein [Aquisphaera giovannonii]QEH33793.1 FG-GAP repeat protein [Aquisphaera giovannonii]
MSSRTTRPPRADQPSPRHRRPVRLIALALAGISALGVSIAIAVRSLSTQPTWAEIQAAVGSGQTERSGRLLERWLLLHPDDGEATLSLANLRLSAGRREGVEGLLAGVRESSPAWGPAQLRLGELAIERRRAADAEAIFRRLAARDPQAVAPRQRLIYLLSLQQRTAEARERLWELRRILRDPRVLVDLVLQALVDPQDVRSLPPELEEYIRETPDDPFLRRAWGMALLYKGKPDEAIPHLRAAAEGLDNDPLGRLALVECLIALGNRDVDETLLGDRPESPADAAIWWINRGRLAEAAGKMDRAVESFQRASELLPDSREAHTRLANALERTGSRDRAEKERERVRLIGERIRLVFAEHKALKRSGVPRDPALCERLGKLCVDAGLSREGRAWLEEAISIDPLRESAHAALSSLSGVGDTPPFLLARPILKHLASSEHGRPLEDAAASTAARRHDRGTPREPISGPGGMGPVFEDRAEDAGVVYRYDSGASDRLHIAEIMGGGVGLIDYDGDGYLDIYFVNGCSFPFDPSHPPSPNRLYRNLRDGHFRDVTAAAGVGGSGFGMGCAVGDYDRDGRPDLFVTGLGRTILYRNRGDGTFEDVTRGAGVSSDRWTTGAGFGDLDGDGDLDLVVLAYASVRLDEAPDCRDGSGRRMHCAPNRFPPQADLLFRNNGDGTFTEASRGSGFEETTGRGLGLAIADFNDDGKLDIFVANDGSANFLYRNAGGLRFEEVGFVSGVATKGSGQTTANMGVVADDLDGDGRIDLFVTNLVNESSTLFKNLGHFLFVDATLAAGLEGPSRSRTGFGDAAFDADNDGLLDLFVANGDVDDRPWANNPMAQAPLFFRNRSSGRFEVTRGGRSFPYLERQVVGRGVAAGDLDNDGRVDLVVVHRDVPASVLMNRTPGGHWLGVRLIEGRDGGPIVGARVACQASGKMSIRWETGGTGYLSAHDQRIWFGLGAHEHADRLEVRWPSGKEQSWAGVAGDRIIDLKEGSPHILEGMANGPGKAPGATTNGSKGVAPINTDRR